MVRLRRKWSNFRCQANLGYAQRPHELVHHRLRMFYRAEHHVQLSYWDPNGLGAAIRYILTIHYLCIIIVIILCMGCDMRKSLVVAALLITTEASAGSVGFQVCNVHGVQSVFVIVKDKKNSMIDLYRGSISKGSCTDTIFANGDEYAELEIKIGDGSAYGVPWVKNGDVIKV